jgi:CheY-like chemotaxis protein
MVVPAAPCPEPAVLVVASSSVLRSLIGFCCRSAGFRPLMADGLSSGLQALDGEQPVAVISGPHLADGTAQSMIQSLRGRQPARHVPVALLLESGLDRPPGPGGAPDHLILAPHSCQDEIVAFLKSVTEARTPRVRRERPAPAKTGAPLPAAR